MSESAKRKRGGQPGNRNALRHAMRAGKLPPELAYLENRLNAFRRQLEDAVIEAKGEISIPDAATINTALKWERHGTLAQRWLTTKYEELGPDQMLYFSREVARASTERDRAIATLKLSRDKVTDVWAVLGGGSNGN